MTSLQRLLLKAVTLLLISALYQFNCIAQLEWYEPAYFDGSSIISFGADPRTHPGISGTYEFSFSVPDSLESLDHEICLLSHGDEFSGTNFQAYINRSRRSLRVVTGSTGVAVIVDFRDTLFHHVAVVTDGPNSQVFIDGVPAQDRSEGGVDEVGWIGIRYAPPLPAGRPLYFGSDGAYSGFTGWISTLRIWNKPLSASEINRLKDVEGLPSSSEGPLNHLIGYSYFTNRQKAFLFTQPRIHFTDYAGGDNGEEFFVRNNYPAAPTDQVFEISSIYMGLSQQGIRDFRVEVTESVDGARDGLSMAYPRRNDWGIGDNINLSRMWLDARNMTGDEFREQKLMMIRTQMGHDSESPELASRTPLRLSSGEEIIGIAGTHDGRLIQTLRFITSEEMSEVFKSDLLERGLIPFARLIPKYARFEGVTGQASSGGLHSIALAYSVPDPDEKTLFKIATTFDRWVGRDAHKPVRAPYSILDVQHGNYTDQDVMTFHLLKNQSDFILSRDSGDSLITVAQLTPRRLDNDLLYKRSPGLDLPFGEWYQSGLLKIPLPSSPNTVYFGGDLITSLSRHAGIPFKMVRPKSYDGEGKDKIDWGGTFSLDHHPALVKANFKGYDIFAMDPRDFQANTGTSKLVFKYPEEDSKSFYASDNKMMIPHGLYFVYDNVGHEGSTTQTSENDDAHTEALSVSVGGSVGIDKAMSYSANLKYRAERKHMRSTTESTTIMRSVETKYALIMDKSRIDLSDEFRERVLELRDEYLAGVDPSYSFFLRAFGTHYPYAVTYGGMAMLEVHDFKSSFTSASEVDIDFEQNASALIDGFSASASGSVGIEEGKEIKRALETKKVYFNTYGGNLSAHEGWSLGKGEEAPLLLDLRPQYELLSPTFFDDPIIWTVIRDGLKDELRSREGQVRADLEQFMSAE